MKSIHSTLAKNFRRKFECLLNWLTPVGADLKNQGFGISFWKFWEMFKQT